VSVQVGVLLPTREAVMAGRVEAAPLLALASQIEAAGFDSVWVGDSLIARPRFEPLTLMAAAAAITRRVRLGTAVLLPALRHPLLLAHAVASLDRIAEGRVVLGVGVASDNPPVRREFEAAGVPFGERVGRLVQGLALCRRLWSVRGPDERVSFASKYWTLDGVQVLPTPHRPGGPPIWMGGNAPGALRRAGETADGWFPNSATADVFAEGWRQVQAHARQAGRADAVTAAIYLTLCLDDDRARAEDTMRRFIEGYYAQPYEAMAARQGCHAGPAEGAAAWIEGFVRAGARHVVLRFAGADQADQLARAAALLPRLRAAA